MSNTLLKELKLFQENKDNFMGILSYLTLKIKYLTYKLNYSEASTDLIIFLFEITKTLNLDKFNNSNELLYYLKKCLTNKAIKLSYKINKYKNTLVFNSEPEIFSLLDKNFNDTEFSDIIFDNLISFLKPKEKDIIYYKFYLQLSDCEIAEILNISRQAINKSKRLALTKLKYQLLKGEIYYG